MITEFRLLWSVPRICLLRIGFLKSGYHRCCGCFRKNDFHPNSEYCRRNDFLLNLVCFLKNGCSGYLSSSCSQRIAKKARMSWTYRNCGMTFLSGYRCYLNVRFRTFPNNNFRAG